MSHHHYDGLQTSTVDSVKNMERS